MFIESTINLDNSYLKQLTERIYQDKQKENYRLFAIFQNCKYVIAYQTDKRINQTVYLAFADNKARYISRRQFEESLELLARQLEESFESLQ